MGNNSSKENEIQISIIIPSFNRANVISETLDSVLAQTFQNWEAVIVDDGSTDNTVEIAKEYSAKDSRFRVYTRDRDPKGGNTCRNIGLNKAIGKYVIFLDSDDLLSVDALEGRKREMEANVTLDMCIFPMAYFSNKPGDTSEVWLFNSFDDYLTGFLLVPQWSITSPIWKKDSLIKLNGFDELLKAFQDNDLHCRALIMEMKFKVLKDKIDCYCRRNEQVERVSRNFNKNYHVESRLAFIDKMLFLLRSKGKIDRVRGNILVGKYLTVSRIYRQMNDLSKADSVWGKVKDLNLVSSFFHRLGTFYLKVRCTRFIENNVFLRRLLLKVSKLLFPKYVIWQG